MRRDLKVDGQIAMTPSVKPVDLPRIAPCLETANLSTRFDDYRIYEFVDDSADDKPVCYTPREKLWHVAAVVRLQVFRGNNRSGSARVLVNAATQKVPFSTACGIHT